MREFKDYKFAVIRGKTAFFVRSVGHFRVLPDNREGIKTADFGEIFWCLEGKGLFSLNGRRHTLLPGQVWYYPPVEAAIDAGSALSMMSSSFRPVGISLPSRVL